MRWVRGKLGGPCALLVHHSGQRQIDGHALRSSVCSGVLATAVLPAWCERISTLRLTASRVF